MLFALLLLVAISTIGGWYVGRAVRIRYEERKALAASKEPAVLPPAEKDRPVQAAEKNEDESVNDGHDPLEGFPYKLKDVLSRVATDDDVLITGALVFSETKEPIAVAYLGKEKNKTVCVAVFKDKNDLFWLDETELGPAPTDAPALTRESAHGTITRTRRLPVQVVRIGADAPQLGSRVVIHEYHGDTDLVSLIITGDEKQLEGIGEAVPQGVVEHWGALFGR